MKGTTPQTGWAALAESQTPMPTPKARPTSKTISRVTLALLDEYSDQKTRGYDPYDTRSSARSADVWRRKPKRD
jgi:hypothetical protein